MTSIRHSVRTITNGLNLVLVVVASAALAFTACTGTTANPEDEWPPLPRDSDYELLSSGVIWQGRDGSDYWVYGGGGSIQDRVRDVSNLLDRQGWQLYVDEANRIAGRYDSKCLMYADFRSPDDPYVDGARWHILDGDPDLHDREDRFDALLLVQGFPCD